MIFERRKSWDVLLQYLANAEHCQQLMSCFVHLPSFSHGKICPHALDSSQWPMLFIAKCRTFHQPVTNTHCLCAPGLPAGLRCSEVVASSLPLVLDHFPSRLLMNRRCSRSQLIWGMEKNKGTR